LIADDAQSLYDKLKTAGYDFVSKELVHQQMNGVHTKSFIVRDPDGHAMLIKEYAAL
jgi:extradiol dioxygenase family protein